MHIVHRAREILSKPSDNRKQWLDRLFIVHAVFSGLWGSLSFIFPHLIAYLFGEEYHHQLRYNPDAETKVIRHTDAAGFCSLPWLLNSHGDSFAQVAHVIVRMFGALVLGQSWLVWNARAITDGEIRRAFVQARRRLDCLLPLIRSAGCLLLCLLASCWL